AAGAGAACFRRAAAVDSPGRASERLTAALCPGLGDALGLQAQAHAQAQGGASELLLRGPGGGCHSSSRRRWQPSSGGRDDDVRGHGTRATAREACSLLVLVVAVVAVVA